MTQLNMGGTVSNSSGLSMSRADIKIRILNTVDDGIHINVSGQFSIISSENQTASLAFVYPSYWGSYGAGTINIGLNISVDNNPINYTLVSWMNLNSSGFQTNSSTFGGTWIESADFVLFSYPVIAEETHLIEVNIRAYPLSYGNYASFTYIIGTARTFLDETHQTVEMHIVEEREFLEMSFNPDEFLTTSTNTTGTTAIWDLIIDSESNITFVQFYAKTNEYVPFRPFPYTIAEVVGIGGSVAIIVSIVVVIILRKRH